MTFRFLRLLMWVVSAAIVFAAVGGDPRHELEASSALAQEVDTSALLGEPLQPLPSVPNLDPDVVALGRKLFNDRILSANSTVACSTCHNLALGGADGLRHSVGINGAHGSINAPTIFNSSYNFVQFWDGRAVNLEQQARGPIENPIEMGSKLSEAVEKLSNTPEYQKLFQDSFGGPPDADTLLIAISTYERSLTTPNAPFDRFLRGDRESISDATKKGYELFKVYGCVSCHQGRNVGGNMYQKLGIMGDYFADRGNSTEIDNGRYNVTHNPDDMHVFKVPSLRNVELTAPYFHDGSAQTLEQAVRVMGKYQLGRILSDSDVSQLVAFLKSLTGDQPR